MCDYLEAYLMIWFWIKTPKQQKKQKLKQKQTSKQTKDTQTKQKIVHW